MSIKSVLFDLDGTLLPMDQDLFLKTYLHSLAKRVAPLGFEPKALVNAILVGSNAMVKNDGQNTNETVFWNKFSEIFGADVRRHEPHFDAFYREEFDNVKSVCGYNEDSARVVKILKEMGLRLVLATNPVFPSIATEKRSKWAGIDLSDFELYTTYENSRFCKPSLEYYEEILARIGIKPEEVLMVGNDVSDDMVAEKLGMKVFLLTDCLINLKGEDISVYPNGSFDDLMKYIKSMV